MAGAKLKERRQTTKAKPLIENMKGEMEKGSAENKLTRELRG